MCIRDSDNEDLVESAFSLLYGKSHQQAWELFVEECQPGAESGEGWSLTHMKEFTYWLFKRRLHYWDPARVASDTRKAMLRLNALEQRESPPAQGSSIQGTLIFADVVL